MKLRNTIYAMAALAGATLMGACEDHKELIIIEGNLPIKSSTLYLVGDATPSGWSIDTPTAMEPSEQDPMIFTWEGNLYAGELKLCLTPGSWDAPFIRPVTGGEEIGTEPIVDQVFDMHAGDPDNKWKVVAAGKYNLSFNLREWTMSTTYLGEGEKPVIEPIKTDKLYMVGDFNGWNIDAPTELEKTGEYTFKYEGMLPRGEFKACTATGSWDVSFIRPSSEGVEINKDGVAADDFVFTASPDHKWKVTEQGNYLVVFDLEKWTIAVTYTGEVEITKDPIKAEQLYMIGGATPGGWAWDDAQIIAPEADDEYIFVWEGELKANETFKASIVRDDSYGCPFIRPESDKVEVGKNGVAAPGFVFTTSPDDQWLVTEAGTYRLTFDLRQWTINAEYKGNGTTTEPEQPEDPTPGVEPLETSSLYMIGDATPGGWSMDNLTALTQDADNKYIFTWEGQLIEGSMKACVAPDGTFSCPFLRPVMEECEISANGAAAPECQYTAGDPDNKWKVTEAGKYRIRFDLQHYTIEATKLN